MEEVAGQIPDSSVDLPGVDDTQWWDRVDRLTGHGRPLFLQILGICLARNESLAAGLGSEEGLNTLLDEMLSHESHKRWPDLFPNEEGESRETIRKSAAYQHVLRAAAFVTLTRGISLPKHADQLLQAAGGSAEHLRSVLMRLLHANTSTDTDAAEQLNLPPLEPDLIGERLLLRLSQQETESSDLLGLVPQTTGIDARQWIDAAIRINPAGTMQTIQLVTQDFPSSPATLTWIRALMDVVCADDFDAATESAKIVTALTIPGLYVTYTKGPIELPQDVWDSLAVFTGRSELHWRSAFVDLLIGLPAVLSTELHSSKFHHELLKLVSGDLPSSLSIESQHLIAQGAVNAVSDYGTHQRWDELERWGDVIADCIERAAPDHQTFHAMLAICLQLAFKSKRECCWEICLTLVEYWPGFILDIGEQAIPIAMLGTELAGATSTQSRRWSDALERIKRWNELFVRVKSALEEDTAPDTNQYKELWRERMCSPDYGEFLRPILDSLGLLEKEQR